MTGKAAIWPDWPEFSASDAECGDDLVGYKQAILETYGKDSLIKSWLKVCKELELVTANLSVAGNSIIPVVPYDDIFGLGSEEKQKLKDVGCFIIRNVYSGEQADEWFKNLKDYVAANRQSVQGRGFHVLQLVTGN